jgi:hypothetical protein
MSQLPADFKEFLKLLDAHCVEYLMIGGYAVGYYGYPRATADLDIWAASTPDNAERLVAALREFGFSTELSPALFLQPDRIVRMGVPPFRIEIATTISGVRFEECYGRRVNDTVDDVAVSIIGLLDLK